MKKHKKKQAPLYDKIAYKLHRYGCQLKINNYPILGEIFLNILYFINIFLFRTDYGHTSRAFLSNRYQSGLAELYEPFFSKIKKKPFGNVLEIGIGGHNDITGGGGLRSLKKIFKQKIIYGLDINDKSHLSTNRIKIIQGSQNDDKTYKKLKNIKFDLIIDDGSHYPAHQLKSFKKLFNNLNPGGVYIIEDLNYSFYGGKLNIIDYFHKNQKFLLTNKSKLAKLYFASTNPSQKAIIFEKRDYNFKKHSKKNKNNPFKTKEGYIKKV
jgi:hypothetical protein